MGTTIKNVIEDVRSLVADTNTSRSSSEQFLEHKTGQPFAKSPISKRDGFEVTFDNYKLTSAFGITGDKEGEFFLHVWLGHAPFGTDDVRENYRAQDTSRLADVLEAHGFPTGVQAVWYEGETVNKENPDWWITDLKFRISFTGGIES